MRCWGLAMVSLAFLFVFTFTMSFTATERAEAVADPCCYTLPCPPACSPGFTVGKWWKTHCVPAEYGHPCWGFFCNCL